MPNKKIAILLAAPLLLGALASSCGTAPSSSSGAAISSSKEKNYYIVTFDYNLESKQGTYISLVVNKDATIEAPKNPEAENYIFEGWYKDPECTQKYLRWGLQIDSDFTLYAGWNAFEECSIEEKINGFEEKLAAFGKDVVKIEEEAKAMYMCPGAGSEEKYYANNKNVYNRYRDITTKDYYQYKEDGSLWHFGQEQFSYDSSHFYNIYHDFEDSTQNEYNEYTFDQSQIVPFISIDFQNLYKFVGKNIISYSSNPKYDEETFSYVYTGNFTTLNSGCVNYSYEEAYFVSDYSSSAGDYVSYQYAYEIGLRLSKGVITGAKILSINYWAIGQDIMEYLEEDLEYTFYYNGGQFADFTGERYTA